MKRALLLLPALLLSSVALAQQETDREILIKDITEIEEDDWDIVRVDGQLVGPDGELIVETKRPKFAPMIHLRTDFSVEMSDSVADVK